MVKFNFKTKVYLFSIYIIGTVFGAYLLWKYSFKLDTDIYIFLVFTIIAESLIIFMPNQGGVSVSFGIILPIAIFYGPGAAIACSALGSLFAIYKVDGEYNHLFNRSFYKSLFNVLVYVISSGISSLFYLIVNNGLGISSLYFSIIYMFVASLIFIIINAVLLGVLLSLISETKVKEIWKQSFSGLIPNVLGIGTLSIVIALAYKNFGATAIIIIYFPFLLTRYSFQLVFDMRQSYIATIKALSSALEEKDPYTKGHAERVEKYSLKLAGEIDDSKINMEQLQYAAIFHDIGKIGIMDNILNKPGKLTNEEFEYIKSHPLKGVKILDNVPFLKVAAQIIGAHHEYYDGTGYPKGIDYNDIPLESRIITIADIFDAVTTDRPYRKAMTYEQAIDIIRDEAGKKLDPRLVETFLKLYNEGRLI